MIIDRNNLPLSVKASNSKSTSLKLNLNFKFVGYLKLSFDFTDYFIFTGFLFYLKALWSTAVVFVGA